MMLSLEESVRLLIDGLAETNRKFAEANAKFAETTERLAQKTAEETERLAQKTAEATERIAQKTAETTERLAQKTAETTERLAEENAKLSEELHRFKEENHIGWEKVRLAELESKKGFEALRKSQKKTEDSFNTQWGKLVEALVKNQIVPLFNQRDIPVNHTNQRVEGATNGKRFEFDIIAENGDTIIVIEVKTTLRVDDVRYFLEKMGNFRELLPRYANMKVYAAVAFLHQASDASLYAEREGLFSILATGSSATITNPPEFRPHPF